MSIYLVRQQCLRSLVRPQYGIFGLQKATLSVFAAARKDVSDPRLQDLKEVPMIEDQFAAIRDNYGNIV